MLPLRFTFLAFSTLLLLCATTPHVSGGSALITYYNFNDSNLVSDAPGPQPTTITVNNLGTTFSAGTNMNTATGDTGLPANMALRLTDTNNGGGNAKTFQFSVSTLGFTNLTLSYATLASNAFFTQTLLYSTNGGASFTTVGTFTPTLSAFTVKSFGLGAFSAVNNQANVIFQIAITQSGQEKNQYNDFDNIQLTGDPTPVPEPSTWIGGAFAVIAIAGSQRKQLRKLVRRVG